MQRVKVAVIGCGGISEIYLTNMTGRYGVLDVIGCSDLIEERSANRAKQFGIRQMTNDEIFADDSIKIVVVLTYPDTHYEVTKAALMAGKHVFCEKMMASTFAEGLELNELANRLGLMYCAAPDTFMGGGFQSVRKYVDSGLIGTPLFATALVVRGYHHAWENADPYRPFIFMRAGGIPYDMGGYYIHALVNTLGPIARVSGFAKTFFDNNPRLNPRHPEYKQDLVLETPTIMSGTLEFACGVYGSLTTLSDGFGETSRIELYGTEGILVAHDPNLYGEAITLTRKGEGQQPLRLPYTHGYYDGNFRGLAVADMAWALINGRKPRCSSELGLHALEVVHGIRESSYKNITYKMTTSVERPAPLPSGYDNSSAAEACLDN